MIVDSNTSLNEHVGKDGEDDSAIIEYMPDMKEIHSKIPHKIIPKIGQKFESKSMAHDFYQRYSKLVGFGTRKSTFHKDKISGNTLDRIFCCSREGYRGNDKRNPYVRKNRALSRSGCGAMIQISS